tara:strand:+ start:4994 stop:5422 length:429 start_codon:yes stop_codon:yes gene_type:complete
MKYLTHVVIVFLMILNVYLFTFCKCKQIKEQFSVSDALKDNSLLDHLKQQDYHKKLLDPTIIKEKFSISNEQIQRMESNAVQLLKDLQQLKYINKNEKVVAEEEYDDVVSESDIEEEEEHENEHENEIEGFVEMCTSNCSSV